MADRKYEVIPTNKFLKELEKLSDVDKDSVLDTLEYLKDNPYYPSLRTKKIDKKSRLFESSVNMDIRILWKFKENKIILLLNTGHHDIVRKLKGKKGK